MNSVFLLASRLAAATCLGAVLGCHQIEPLVGPKETGALPTDASASESMCETILDLGKTFTKRAPVGRRASFSGVINGSDYANEYIIEFGGCDEQGCHDKLFTKDASGNLSEVHDEKLTTSRAKALEACLGLGMHLDAVTHVEKTVRVPAGTFKVDCLRTTISMSFAVTNSTPKPATAGQNDSLTSQTVTEYCLSMESDSAGIPVQMGQRTIGAYNKKDIDPVTADISASTTLLKILN